MTARAHLDAMSRRRFLWAAAGLGASVVAAPLLGACQQSGPTTVARGVGTASPDNPVRLPLSEANPAVESGLDVEPGPLRILNWGGYLSPAVRRRFAEEYGVEVELETFPSMREGQRRVEAGDDSYDLFFPSPDVLPELAAKGHLQPLNHSYLPNRANVWQQLQDPFYDLGSRFSVPYTVYSHGVLYRTDLISEVPAEGSDMLWDPRHRGRVGVGSAPRDVLAMALLRLGEDVNSADPAVLDRAAAELDELARAAAPRVGRTVGPLLKGRFVASWTFSGTAFYAPDYLPRGVDQEVLGFWFPADRRGLVVNDCMAVPASAKNPVLAHAFIDFLLDEQVALDNLSWTGYQPPQQGLTPATLAAGGYLASNLQSAMLLPKDFDRSQQLLPLEPDVEAMYDTAFEGFSRTALQQQRELTA